MLTYAVGEYRVALLAAYAYKFFLLAQPALPASLRSAVADSLAAGTKFTCFTGLHARSAVADSLAAGTHFTCFTGTRVQMLTRGGAAAADRPVSSGTQVLSCSPALLVQKYKY